MPPLTPEQQELFDTFKKIKSIDADSWVNHCNALAACLDAGFNPYSYLP